MMMDKRLLISISILLMIGSIEATGSSHTRNGNNYDQQHIPENAHHAFRLVQNRLAFYLMHKHKLSSFMHLLGQVNMNEAIVASFARYLETSDFKAGGDDETCSSQIDQLYTGIFNLNDWALRIVDSYGKPPAGILDGSVYWLGDFSECSQVKTERLNGKHCVISLLSTIIPDVYLIAKYGVCIPNMCNSSDVATAFNQAVSLIPPNITQLLPVSLYPIDASQVTCDEPKELDTAAIIAITVLSILGSIVIFSTLYELYHIAKDYLSSRNCVEHEVELVGETSNVLGSTSIKSSSYLNPSKSVTHRILISFSIYSNTMKLFKINRGPNPLRCLHAIRVITISWVILGHNYYFQLSTIDNLAYVYDVVYKRFATLILNNAEFSVDTFFLLSGLLTCYMFLEEIARSKLSFGLMLKYYIHRIWRLTPPYAIVIMVEAVLTKYFGRGPLFPKDGFEYNQCKDSWWTNLLYLNNLVRADQVCYGITWYLANDMQFHFIAPIALIPFALGKKWIGVIIAVLAICSNLLTTSLIMSTNPNFGTLAGLTTVDFYLDIYIKPWCRIGPFAIGVLLGFALIEHKRRNKFRMNLITNIVLWLVSLSIMGLVFFGNYGNYIGHEMDRVSLILYTSSYKIIWAFGVAFIIFSCVTTGGVVNRLLSWSIWEPLSKLSYSTYLIHQMIILIFVTNQQRPTHYEDYFMFYMFIGHITMSFAAGYVLSMFFEVPLIGLEKFIFKRH